MTARQPNASSKQLGQRIKMFRLAAGLTLDELVDRMFAIQDSDDEPAIDQTPNKGHLSHIENGKGNPTYDTLRLIARALDISVVDLVNSNGRKAPRQAVIERTRTLSDEQNVELMALAEARFGPTPPLVPKVRKRPRRRVTKTSKPT